MVHEAQTVSTEDQARLDRLEREAEALRGDVADLTRRLQQVETAQRMAAGSPVVNVRPGIEPNYRTLGERLDAPAR